MSTATETKVNLIIDLERKYKIEDVAFLTDYSTGYLRDLERAKKIPPAERDEKGWRYWKGADVLKILLYKREHVVKQPATTSK